MTGLPEADGARHAPGSEPRRRTILCLSRSYLAHLLPTMGARDEDATYLHIVQSDREAALVTAQGQRVVLNLQDIGRRALRAPMHPWWVEPADFRDVTGYRWSAIYADRHLPNYPVEQHRAIAELIFEELKTIFETWKIDGFLSEPVALFTTHVIFYFCRKFDVKPLLWCNSYVPEYFYFADRIDISVPVRSTPMQSDEEARVADVTQAYLEGVSQDRRGPAYHPSFIEKPLSFLSYFQQLRGREPLVMRPGLTTRMIQRARLIRARLARLGFPNKADFMTAGAVSEHQGYLRYLKTSDRIYDVPPEDFDQRNVMYPVQYEPEASLIYFAPEFHDQVNFVELVLRGLPDDKVLWIKEHPNQFGALGEEKWRQLKRRYANLRFVHGRQNGRRLIRSCALAVSISSSAGMDALVLGRRTVVAGRVPYRYFAGAIPISSAGELVEALNDPSHYATIDNRAELVEQMVEFGRGCYRGDPQPAHGLYADENLALLIGAIHAETATTAGREPSPEGRQYA